MPSFLVTILNDDGTVSHRHGSPMFREDELAAKYIADNGRLTVRELGGDGVLFDANLVTMLLAGSETVSWLATAIKLEAIAARLRQQVP